MSSAVGFEMKALTHLEVNDETLEADEALSNVLATTFTIRLDAEKHAVIRTTG